MEIKTALSSKGQIVIPKTLRDTLGLELGTELSIHLRADQVIEIRVLKQDIKSFLGRGKRLGQQPLSIEDIDRLIEQTVGTYD